MTTDRMHEAARETDLNVDYVAQRAAHPVHWDSERQLWRVTGYAEVSAALRDRRLSARRPVPNRSGLPTAAQALLGPIDGCFASWLVFREPPDHMPLRHACAEAMTPFPADDLAARIQSKIDQLLDATPQDEPFDLIRSFAYPLPVMNICEIFGIPGADLSRISAWLQSIVRGFGTGNGYVAAARSYTEMSAYLVAWIEKQRSASKPDALLEACDSGSLRQDEAVANYVFLLLAGHDTTTNMIGNGVLTLLQHPVELARLRADASLLPAAIEELLRFESPVQEVRRTVAESLTLGGCTLETGQAVLLSIGAANRDPAMFDQPNHLRLDRRPNPHLAFIAGVHQCLGTHLARLEARLVFSTLLRRFGSLELAEPEVHWTASESVRGLERLMVRGRS